LRRAILGVVVVITGAGCTGMPHLTDRDLTSDGTRITIERSPSPYSEITAGAVQALVPDGWRPVPESSGAREGFFASPSPEAWGRMDGFTEGIAATWVDATVIGIPSDFYYLAATGPLFSHLIHSATCRAESRRVFVDNLPAFASGSANSPGDYMARGEGTCRSRGRVTRWAYFVAAPGFGPVHQLGIARSGLYVVVAVLRDGRRAGRMLDHLIGRTRFGEARIGDFVKAVRDRRIDTA
jgi:hypothetical protein